MKISLYLVLFCLSFSDLSWALERGFYFPKKTYVYESLPGFNENRSQLPSPILEGNPDYVELYWKAWEIAFDHHRQPLSGSPFVSNYIDDAFAPNIFQWDTAFMVLFGRYAEHIFPSVQSFDNFYSRQHRNGYISREISEAEGTDIVYHVPADTVNPPLFAWVEWQTYLWTGNKKRIHDIYLPLKKYAEYLEKDRKLSHTVHELYWNTPLGSGMDNTPRAGSGWVDMSAQMVQMYQSLAEMAKLQGLHQEHKLFAKQADKIAKKINQYMWNEADGLYYDVNDLGEQNKHKTVACFWPMLMGIASEHQVGLMVQNLKDPKTFWRVNVFPSLAADHPLYQGDGKYWVGSVWAPNNVAIIKGLERYGYNQFAYQATKKYLDNIFQVYKETGTIWENYAPEFVSRGSWSKPDFVGWSGAGPIQLLIENIIGIQTDPIKKQINWIVQRNDRHGLHGLRFQDVTTSLEISPGQKEVFVESDRAYTLRLVFPNKITVYQVQPGRQRISL